MNGGGEGQPIARCNGVKGKTIFFLNSAGILYKINTPSLYLHVALLAQSAPLTSYLIRIRIHM